MPATESSSPDSKTIQSFFDSIPERYDFLNSVLSLSLDKLWRRALVKAAMTGEEKSFLDIGTGTGTSLLSFLKEKQFGLAVGCDFSKGMLKIAKEKVEGAFLAAADLHALPFGNERFDLVASSFVLRSVKQMDQFLSEVWRILKKGGRFAFLDLTRPKNQLFWNFLYRPYLNVYLPTIGKVFSRHPHAYEFLSQSIQAFAEPELLQGQMRRAGFHSLECKPLSGGIATIFTGRK